MSRATFTSLFVIFFKVIHVYMLNFNEGKVLVVWYGELGCCRCKNENAPFRMDQQMAAHALSLSSSLQF